MVGSCSRLSDCIQILQNLHNIQSILWHIDVAMNQHDFPENRHHSGRCLEFLLISTLFSPSLTQRSTSDQAGIHVLREPWHLRCHWDAQGGSSPMKDVDMDWYGGFHTWGDPNSWMVFVGEDPNLRWMMTRCSPIYLPIWIHMVSGLSFGWTILDSRRLSALRSWRFSSWSRRRRSLEWSVVLNQLPGFNSRDFSCGQPSHKPAVWCWEEQTKWLISGIVDGLCMTVTIGGRFPSNWLMTMVGFFYPSRSNFWNLTICERE